MIPKKSKPEAKDLRPIALTNYSYKIFMAILKDKIENHLRSNREIKENQAGFTAGARIEDNLFIMQYCVEESYKKKTPLIVTSIDFTKAFDSIKREKIIEALIKYKVHPTIITIIANIYEKDNTKINFTKDLQTNMEVTSSIRQGCTGSTSLFILLTYMIIEKIEVEGRGFHNRVFNINSLFFADDRLLFSCTVRDAEWNIRMLTEVSKECGLDVNKEKSNVIIFNMEDQPATIEGIPVSASIKYLGIDIGNNRNFFGGHKKQMVQKAQKLANLTYSVIARSCHKITVGKAYWKNVALPSILYGTSIIKITEAETEKLQTIENSVYRQILGAPRYAQNSTLRGEIGSSRMRTRVIEGTLLYMKSIIEEYKTVTINGTQRHEDTMLTYECLPMNT